MNDSIVKMLAGTIARGLIWVVAALAAWLGVEAMPASAVQAVAEFAAAGVLAGAAMLWSTWKNRKLLETPPPPK
ncbi:MAG: hypothetical protein HZA50_11545 [Planctomycetes bacterium]|nr:hypothetical protein [Planctomycetota bacterium]